MTRAARWYADQATVGTPLARTTLVTPDEPPRPTCENRAGDVTLAGDSNAWLGTDGAPGTSKGDALGVETSDTVHALETRVNGTRAAMLRTGPRLRPTPLCRLIFDSAILKLNG